MLVERFFPRKIKIRQNTQNNILKNIKRVSASVEVLLLSGGQLLGINVLFVEFFLFLRKKDDKTLKNMVLTMQSTHWLVEIHNS